jgi:hypothetical protein
MILGGRRQHLDGKCYARNPRLSPQEVDGCIRVRILLQWIIEDISSITRRVLKVLPRRPESLADASRAATKMSGKRLIKHTKSVLTTPRTGRMRFGIAPAERNRLFRLVILSPSLYRQDHSFL